MISRSAICCVLLVLLVSLQAAAEGGKRSKGHDRHHRSIDCSSSEDCLYSDDTTFGHYDYHDFLRGHRREGRSVHSKKRVGSLILEEADALVLDHHILEDDD